MLKRCAILSAALLGFALIAPSSDACPIYRPVNPTDQALSSARYRIRSNDYAGAAKAIKQAFPTIRQLRLSKKPKSNQVRLSRALTTMAIATIRGDGLVEPSLSMSSVKKRERNIRWAISTLRRLVKQQPKNAQLQSNLAEGLAKLPSTQREGLQIMSDLASKGQINDAHGFATLADLLHSAGRTTERDAAARKCHALSRQSSICPVYRKDLRDQM